MTNEDYNNFISLSSYSGLKALYIMKLSLESKTAFNRHNIPKEIFPSSSDYFYGYIVACTAFGIVSFNLKDNIITVTELNPYISEQLEEAINKRIKNNTGWKTEIELLKKHYS